MTQAHVQKNIRAAAITYVIFFWPFLVSGKKDEFLNYHFKQSIGLVIFGLAGQGIISICGYWGFSFSFIMFLVYALRILLVVGMLAGIKNALAGKTYPLPYIGKYAEKF